MSLSFADHKRQINERIDIMDCVNDKLYTTCPTFRVHGNASSEYKVFLGESPCTYYGDLLMLCLLKQILDNNLMFYVGSLKHAKTLEDAMSKTSITSELHSGKRRSANPVCKKHDALNQKKLVCMVQPCQ